MWKVLTTAALTSLLLAAPSMADGSSGVSFAYENFRRHENGNLEIVLKFVNETDRDVSFVRASCAFLDGDMRAVTTENVIAQRVSAHSHAYARNYVLKPGAAKKAECRITAVDY